MLTFDPSTTSGNALASLFRVWCSPESEATMAGTPMPDIRTLAPAVATHLGTGWKSEPHPEYPHRSAHLTHQDGRQVRLYIDPYASGPNAGRLHALGQQPEPPSGITVEHSSIDFGRITLAGTKTPRQVSAEVSRRLLPVLAAALATWQAKVEQLCSQEAERMATAHRLAEVLGAQPPSRAAYGSGLEKRKLHLGWAGTARGTEQRWTTTPRARVEVDANRSGEYVHIELSGLSAAQAERVLRALLDEEQQEAALGS